MDYTQISIIKRDGKTEPFSLDKIVRAITKAFRAGGITDEGQAVEQIASDVAAAITKAEISVEEIQDMVEERLMKRNPPIAKRYISSTASGATSNATAARRSRASWTAS